MHKQRIDRLTHIEGRKTNTRSVQNGIGTVAMVKDPKYTD